MISTSEPSSNRRRFRFRRVCRWPLLLVTAIVVAGALFQLSTLPRGTATEGAASPSVQDVQQSLLHFVPDRMAHYHVPGLSLACIHNGTVEWTQAFGVARVGEPLTPGTLFQASSIGMPVTAVAVLRLVEQGKLNLDVDVNQYLRSWKLPSNKFTEQKKVTVRELLSHTAGITVLGYEGYLAGENVPTLVQVLNGEKPAKSSAVTVNLIPGTEYQYASGDYLVVQQILVDVTGESFPELMQKLVLRPLHMVHSSFQQPTPDQPHETMAMPYDKDGKPIIGGPRIHPEMAAAGLWTTPSDLALFALGIQNALAGKPGSIVSPSTAHEMLQPALADYGLGFSIAGNGSNRYFWHPGANLGFLSVLFAYEKGDGVVAMTNGDTYQSKALVLEVVQALSKQYGWTEYPAD